MPHKTRILFVCLGNIVRSPLAENLFRHLVEEAGLSGVYEFDSAGTGNWHAGDSPDPRMRQVAARYGLQYDGRARQFDLSDFDRFDLIIPMDLDNQDQLFAWARSASDRDKIILLRAFDPQGSPTSRVPDPYYGGIDGFEKVYSIVERSCRGLLKALEEGEVP